MLCGALYTVECVRNVVVAENICLTTQRRRQVYDYTVIGNVLCFYSCRGRGMLWTAAVHGVSWQESLTLHGPCVMTGPSHMLCMVCVMAGPSHMLCVVCVCVCACVRA